MRGSRRRWLTWSHGTTAATDSPAGGNQASLTPELARLAAAWDAVHDATPEGWYVGRPMEHPERNEWSMFAFDRSETPVVGKRANEWTAVGYTELHCVQTMAYCLGELREGRWPK
jgi:hypothetical protein